MENTGRKEKFHVREEVTISEDNTGEVIKTARTEVAMFESEPAYVKLYLNDLCRMNGLNNSQQKILNALVKNMGYNNVLPSYKPVKEMIAESLGMPYNTLNEGIKELHKKGIIIRKARGFYIMDPNLFGRGSWNDVKKIRMVIEYNADGTKSINTEISKQLRLFE
jgi:biotin operon repressor